MLTRHVGFRLKVYLILGILLFSSIRSLSQTYVYAQLQGTPVNTTGWSLAGAATIGNITGTGNSEVILCPAQLTLSGAIFFNQPINLSNCKKWTAEFDFRIFDGTAADGIAFCFLDVPPSGFVTGGGLGIPSTANGLKVCFDQYPNCSPAATPKIEIRWGPGYNECWTQPTADNTTGMMNFIRSNTYNHAKITYDNGNINVYVNNTLYLSAFQQFNFTGYLGFTASTGGSTDNHSIKNVVIYTEMPPSEAGADKVVCSGEQLQTGTSPNSSYVYTWTPGTDLSSTSISDPTINIVNTTNADIIRKYYVQTAFANAPGCSSIDSITVTVKKIPVPSVSINPSGNNICLGSTVTFTATPVDGGAIPNYQWKVNGINAGSNSATFSSNTLVNGDIVSCSMTSNAACVLPASANAISNNVAMIVNPLVNPSVSITPSSTVICNGSPVAFTAIAINGGPAPIYQWKINGTNAGTNSPSFSSNTLANGDIVSCVLNSNNSCISSPTVVSNDITMTVNPVLTPVVTIAASASDACQGNNINFTATPVNEGTTPSYQWKINGTNAGTNGPSFSSNTLTNGDIVSCELTSNATCVSPAVAVSNAASITIRPRLTPTISIAASKESICTGASVDFTATPANGGVSPSYQWKINGVNAGTNSPTFSNNTFANGDIVSCELTSSEDCVTTSNAFSNNVVMNVNPFVSPSVNISSSATTICRGDEVVFNATAFDAAVSPSYQWKINGINAGTNDPTFKARGLTGDDEIICVITPGNNSCSIDNVSSNTIAITINPLPVITILPADTIVKLNSQVQLTALVNGNITSYTWLPVAAFTTTSSLSLVTIPLNATTDYWLNAVSEDGCPVSKKATVRVFNKLLMPNAFTPNNDGRNDVYRIPPDVSLVLKDFSIYNRWGQRIFFTTDITKGWDGAINGEKGASSVYIYLVSGYNDEGPVFLKGSFVLIR